MKFDLNKLKFVEENINPQKLAIIASDTNLTWKDLKVQVEEKKKQLINLKLKKNNPVIIYGHKQANFLVYITACISLQIPYIPVDTIYPQERINEIAKLSGAAAIINITNNTIKILNTATTITAKNIIYIIYTSGSTGAPKGVQINNEAIVSFIEWIKEDFKFNENNIFINQALISFDLSVIDIFSTLLLGATIFLTYKELIEDNNKFIKTIKKYKCNTLATTPSFISKSLMISNFNNEYLPHLTNFILIGEIFNSLTAKKLLNSFNKATIVNSYGPSEATFGITRSIITTKIIEKYQNSLPIGYAKQNDNSKIEIINKNNEGIGELVIYGNNVSIGYVDSNLNKNKFFIKNGVRAFCTGDLVYIKDKMLFFAGRIDDQIKFNGYRIELGEIDSTILKLFDNDIINTITLPLKQKEKILRLVSFIITKNKLLNKDQIINLLSNVLPEYMLPSDIMFIDKFKYNANHKIDQTYLIEKYKNS